MDAKRALEETAGDLDKAAQSLREKGIAKAAKKADRETNEGRVHAYIHSNGKLGAMVEVLCETDFVARNEDFIRFSKDVSMHIAALAPKYIKKENVPADLMAKQSDKEDFAKQHCLLSQPFVKDQSKTIHDYLNELIAKIGENIVISHFARFKVGELE